MKINNRLSTVGLLILMCYLVVSAVATHPWSTPCGDCESRNSNGNCVSDCSGSEVCCGGSCCGNACCNNVCCSDPNASCCNDSCCSNTCCDDVCCDPCEVCCNGVCCEDGFCCENVKCCLANQFCCGPDCCTSGFEECCYSGSSSWCAKLCEADNDNGATCSSSHDLPCKACDEGWGDDCSDHTTTIYTGNTLKTCKHGCPSSCEDDFGSDVLCSKIYKCKAIIDYMADCGDLSEIGPVPLDCYPVMEAWNCKECVPDMDELVDSSYLLDKKCS